MSDHVTSRYVTAFYNEAQEFLKTCKSHDAKLSKFLQTELLKDDGAEPTSMAEVEKHAEWASDLKDDMVKMRAKMADMHSVDKLSNKEVKDKKDKDKDKEKDD
jgi:hypothetical protein